MKDFDKYIDDFINEEKKIIPSPFLQSRIVAKLNVENSSHRISLWQSFAVAASIAAAIVSGFFIGNSYASSKGNNYMVINDSQIENLVILTNNAEE